MAAQQSPKMQYRFLGRSGLQVSAIALGGWLTYGGDVDDEGSFACIKAAYEAGVNFFDCAENYSDGRSEITMGKAIKKFGWKRNDIVVSTKLNWGGAFGDNPVNNFGLSRKHIIEGMAASLSRLQLDYVDLIYCHRPDKHTPIEETVRAMNHLINTGKAFYWGTSEWRAEEIGRAVEIANRLGLIAPIMEQPEYSMLHRQKVEDEFFGLYPAYGLGLTVFSPLKMGVLTGKYDEGIAKGSRLDVSKDPYIEFVASGVGKTPWQATIERVKKLKTVADRLETSRAALAIAWVLKNPNVASAITGASKPEQIHDTLKALDVLPKLTDEIMKEIDDILENKPAEIVMRYT